MANAITSQIIQDEDVRLVYKVHLSSDGSNETGTVVIDASTFTPAFTNEQLEGLDIAFSSTAGRAKLLWDADTDVPIIAIGPGSNYRFDWRDGRLGTGGLPNNAGAGVTGDILLTTTTLASGDQLTLIFYIRKVPTAPIQGGH